MKPVASKLILKRLPDQTITKSGLILPSQGKRNTPAGIVMSVPDGYVEGGVLRNVPFHIGDEVLYLDKFAIALDHEDGLYAVDVQNVLAIKE